MLREGEAILVNANDATTFKGVPKPGQQAKIKGIRILEGIVLAKQIQAEESGDTLSFEALILTTPENASTEGEWEARVNRNFKRVLITNESTRFVKGIPRRGEWVEVEGFLLSDGQIQVTRIRRDTFETGEFIARLETGVLSTTIASRYEVIPQESVLESGNIYRFVIPKLTDDVEQIAEMLDQDPDIVWAEPNYKSGFPEANPYSTWKWGGAETSGYVNQYAFEQIGLAPALDSYQGVNKTVAVLDTGVDLNHPTLVARLIPGRDLVDDDLVPQDEGDGIAWGHGTHIAGIVAQLAPQSQIMPVRVLDPDGRGNTLVLAYAIEWATSQGADVINLSLGAEANSQLVRETIEEAIAEGVVVVAAAGNNDSNVPQYPAQYPGVISVSAVDESNQKADFANYGQTWVDVATPGVGIMSTFIGPEGSGFASWSGTSMSTSFVSGAAALALEKTPTATSAELESLFHSTAADLSTSDPIYGSEIGGLLDVAAALVPDQKEEPVQLEIYLPLVIQ